MKNIKKSILLSVALLASGSLAGCDAFNKQPETTNENNQQQQQTETKVEVESLSLNFSELSLTVGDEKDLVATLTPENATDKTVTFSSSKEAVATVSAAGKVTAIKKGTAIITCVSNSNPSKFQTCIVEVEDKEIEVVHATSLEVGETEITLVPGGKQKLQASVLPENATNKKLIWASNNEDSVTVDTEGNIEAVALGQASITVQSEDNPLLVKTFTVKVEETVIPVSGVTVDQTALGLEENESAVQLHATVSPSNASNKSVVWESSDQGVATVSSNGLVTPHKVGESTITVTTVDGSYVDSCVVTVIKVDVTSFTLSEESIVFMSNAAGDAAKKQLTASILPSNATYKEVEWSSSNNSIATVSENGLVEMKGVVGSAVITALHVNSHKTATCTVSVVEPNELTIGVPISRSASYEAFKVNTMANSANPLAEFTDRTQYYEVGDDNKINLKPQLSVFDADSNPVDSNAWSFPFTFTFEKKVNDSYVTASAEDYNIISANTCDVKFNESAVGNIYRVSIMVGGLTAEDIEEIGANLITAVYELKVVDGYNVTNENELAYLDSTTPEAYNTRSVSTQGCKGENFVPDYPAFKASKGLRQDYEPATLVLHKDMNISPENIPSCFIFTEADAVAASWSPEEKVKSIGSLKDYGFIYSKFSTGKTTFSGNYFTLDWSKLPLVKRTNGKTTTDLAKTESHSCFARFYDGQFEIKNINFIGNAHAAKSENDTYLAGGLIGFKMCHYNTSVIANNTLGHGCYITYMNEGGFSRLENQETTILQVNNTKLFDNYNSFIYNWGGKVIAENSVFEGCGGPVVIQDHIGEDEPRQYDSFSTDYASTYSFNTLGYVSETKFIDCVNTNYVLGTEAWFQSFGATALTAQIKGMSDLVADINGTRSYVFDENHAASTYQALALAGKESMFNFIVLNKSSEAEGMTNIQVDGKVEFLHRDNSGLLQQIDKFNYLNPTDLSSAVTYAKFRGAAGLGAPIFETAGGLAFYPEIPSHGLLDLNSSIGLAGVENVVDIGADFVNNAADNIALYYNGMMLVFTLGTF